MNLIPGGRRRLAGLAATAILLAACGGGGGSHDDHDHDPDPIDSAGRLVVIESAAAVVRVHELDSAAAVEASHTLDHVPSAIYRSPQGRYAVLMQRDSDQVQFVDGGLWREDHGDHQHDYLEPSRTMDWKLAGVRPTHYNVQDGTQAAVFLDGDATRSPASPAGVQLIDDGSIATGQSIASLQLDAPIHGLAQPQGDKLLSSVRAADAADALPTHLSLQLRNGSGYTESRQLPTRCDGMHGGASSGSHSAIGCRDGMLLVHHTGPDSTDDGLKLATPLRVSTVAAHPLLAEQFIGIATEGVAPAAVTTRFYALDAAAGSVAPLQPEGWTEGRVRRAHGFDRSGQRFYLLDDEGSLSVLQHGAAGWTGAARVTGVIPAMPDAAPWPAIVANGARDEIYVTDPVAQQLVVVNAVTGAVLTRHPLGYVPAGAVWLGIDP